MVEESDDLMIINKSGVTIRMCIDELRVMGRATQGVRLIRLDDDDAIASVAKVEIDEEEKKAAKALAENPDSIEPSNEAQDSSTPEEDSSPKE